jgi:hypothetical protein
MTNSEMYTTISRVSNLFIYLNIIQTQIAREADGA